MNQEIPTTVPYAMGTSADYCTWKCIGWQGADDQLLGSHSEVVGAVVHCGIARIQLCCVHSARILC